MLVRNASPIGPRCFGAWCLVCQDLLDLSCGVCDIISLYFMC